MDKKWTDGDSARKMTLKYNETVNDVEVLKDGNNQANKEIHQKLDSIEQELDKKIEGISSEPADSFYMDDAEFTSKVSSVVVQGDTLVIKVV